MKTEQLLLILFYLHGHVTESIFFAINTNVVRKPF